jgi:hypothetical protein
VLLVIRDRLRERGVRRVEKVFGCSEDDLEQAVVVGDASASGSGCGGRRRRVGGTITRSPAAAAIGSLSICTAARNEPFAAAVDATRRST